MGEQEIKDAIGQAKKIFRLRLELHYRQWVLNQIVDKLEQDDIVPYHQAYAELQTKFNEEMEKRPQR